MKLTIKNKDGVDIINITDNGVKGAIKTDAFELDVDCTWEELEAKLQGLRGRVPSRARGHVASYLERRTIQEQN